jgi:HMG-box domain
VQLSVILVEPNSCERSRSSYSLYTTCHLNTGAAAGAMLSAEIKSATSAYEFFKKHVSPEVRAQLKEQGGTADLGSVMKEVSARWNALSPEDAEQYHALADEDRYSTLNFHDCFQFLVDGHKCLTPYYKVALSVGNAHAPSLNSVI